MAIITTITTDGVGTETRQRADELLADLPIINRDSEFVDDTMRKVSNFLDGMIPSLKNNTGVAAKAAGINP